MFCDLSSKVEYIALKLRDSTYAFTNCFKLQMVKCGLKVVLSLKVYVELVIEDGEGMSQEEAKHVLPYTTYWALGGVCH